MRPLNIIFCFIIASLIGCDGNRIYEENKKTQDGIWNINNPIGFEIEITDTAVPVNMYINIRNSGAYPYSNLFLFVNTVFPNGARRKDTVECILANETGWLGSGLGDIWDHQILFRKNVRFPLPGNYTISFEQAQRYGDVPYIENLPFIIDIGLRIEKSKL